MKKKTKISQNDFFSGKKLFGDDFNEEQILQWYRDEEEGYANLGNNNKEKYSYQYTAMNELYGFKYIDKKRKFKNALGFGSAYGHEFLPIIEQIDRLTILEPSEQLRSKKLGNLEPIYIKPNVLGNLDFQDNCFDLIICSGVLHHIPNVTFVLSELQRVLSPNGILIVREPIVSMGDWSKSREGLTKNERGIPLNYFNHFIKINKLKIVSKQFCDSSFASRIFQTVLSKSYNSFLIQRIDKFFSLIFSWNYKYHRRNFFEKLAPASIYLVLSKVE